MESHLSASHLEQDLRSEIQRLQEANAVLRARLGEQQQIEDDMRESANERRRAERLEAIGETIAGLAHESRNTLQRSQACLEMLALEVQDRPAALDLIARLQVAQDHLHHLYEEVCDYAAPIVLQRGPTTIDEIVDHSWRALVKDRLGREIAFRAATDGLLCRVDCQALECVFRNVFENSLAVCADPVEIDVECGPAVFRGRPAARVVVRDNGPGLGADELRRIFEPFFTTKTRGTGLGMAICQRLVEAHGGSIAAGNAAQGGAEITIILPLE